MLKDKLKLKNPQDSRNKKHIFIQRTINLFDIKPNLKENNKNSNKN